MTTDALRDIVDLIQFVIIGALYVRVIQLERKR